jgi:hypothetical protein
MGCSASVSPAPPTFEHANLAFVPYSSKSGLACGEFCDPHSYRHSVVADFASLPPVQPPAHQPRVATVEARKQLVGLLACAEQIPDRREVVEAILECESRPDDVFVMLSSRYFNLRVIYPPPISRGSSLHSTPHWAASETPTGSPHGCGGTPGFPMSGLRFRICFRLTLQRSRPFAH